MPFIFASALWRRPTPKVYCLAGAGQPLARLDSFTPTWPAVLAARSLSASFSSSTESVLPVCSPTERPFPGVCGPRQFRSPCASERNALVLVLLFPVPSLARKSEFWGERCTQWLLCSLRQQTQRSPEGPRHLHRIPRFSEAPWEVPYSFVHGISQARILGWVAIPFSRGSSSICVCLCVCALA